MNCKTIEKTEEWLGLHKQSEGCLSLKDKTFDLQTCLKRECIKISPLKQQLELTEICKTYLKAMLESHISFLFANPVSNSKFLFYFLPQACRSFFHPLQLVAIFSTIVPISWASLSQVELLLHTFGFISGSIVFETQKFCLCKQKVSFAEKSAPDKFQLLQHLEPQIFFLNFNDGK